LWKSDDLSAFSAVSAKKLLAKNCFDAAAKYSNPAGCARFAQMFVNNMA